MSDAVNYAQVLRMVMTDYRFHHRTPAFTGIMLVALCRLWDNGGRIVGYGEFIASVASAWVAQNPETIAKAVAKAVQCGIMTRNGDEVSCPELMEAAKRRDVCHKAGKASAGRVKSAEHIKTLSEKENAGDAKAARNAPKSDPTLFALPEPTAKPEPKPRKNPNEKTQYAEAVRMREKDYKMLVANYGEDVAKRCIDTLNNYKLSSGHKYADDYRAILNWVTRRVIDENNRRPSYDDQRNNRTGAVAAPKGGAERNYDESMWD